MSYTRRCVRCLKKPARFWGGYVVRDYRRLIAGWCSERCAGSGPGFRGHYQTPMGEAPPRGAKRVKEKVKRAA
jgi:hypothetical protein